MVRENHVKRLLGDSYLNALESRALSEIADAMEDKTNPEALKRALETLTKIQHEILVRWAKAEDPRYGSMD
jgi:predicted house-cleaning noncanonical NTP pyrophosphatase (MazG superfamily)